MKRWIPVLTIAAIALTASLPVAAQAASEARGQVTDVDGNPVVGAQVIYHAESNPSLEYKGKTSKKGRYFVPGLFTGKQGDMWVIRVEAEGLVPVEMYVESRTSNRTLIAPARTVTLKVNQAIPNIVIRPLGEATVDFKMATLEVARSLDPSIAAAEAAAEAAAAKAQEQQRQADPYDAALSAAQDGDLESSVDLFRKAIDKKPEDPIRRRALAQVLYRMEMYDDAAEEAEAAIELDPGDISGYMVAYGIYVRKGDLESAGRSLAAAKEIDPQNPDLLKQIAFVASENGTVEEQLAAYQAIVEVSPDDTETWLALGDLYAQTGQNAKSEAAYQKVIDLDPGNADQVFYNLGALLVNGDDRSPAAIQKAIGAFRKAVEINPEYGQAYRELAFALLNVGDRPGAKEALERYVKVSPDAPDASQMQALINSL